MAYKRKTKDVWVVQGNYGYGWDDVVEEDTWKEAWDMFICYTENEPQYQHRVKRRRAEP